jgi:hypothetical protein
METQTEQIPMADQRPLELFGNERAAVFAWWPVDEGRSFDII